MDLEGYRQPFFRQTVYGFLRFSVQYFALLYQHRETLFRNGGLSGGAVDIAFSRAKRLLPLCLWNLGRLLLFQHSVCAKARDVCADETGEKPVGICKNTENLHVGYYAFNH